jgi:capsular polysaccharide biosynthesis protein
VSAGGIIKSVLLLLVSLISKRSVFSRGVNRLGRWLVENLRFAPKTLGYRWFRTESLCTYATRQGDEYRIAIPEVVSDYPLPVNIQQRSELSSERGNWGISFYEVPHRTSKAAEFAILSKARIIGASDTFGNEFYSILGAGDVLVDVRGTTLCDGQRRALRVGPPSTHLPSAAWFLEVWYGNYFHWMTFHLPKLLLLDELGWNGPIIGPSTSVSAQRGFIGQTLHQLRTPRLTCIPAGSELFEVEKLAVVNLDQFPDRLLNQLRSRLARPAKGPRLRRFYISRKSSAWRCLVNEAEILPLLLDHGFEVLEPERLSFTAQAEAMAQARVVLGLHGAGLTNMVLCEPGTTIAEISDPVQFPNPFYYALASVLGHRYWLIRGESIDDGRASYLRDFRLDPQMLEELLAACA